MKETFYTVCLIIVCVSFLVEVGCLIYVLSGSLTDLIDDIIYPSSNKPIGPGFTFTLTKRTPESDVNDDTVASDDGENDKINKSE
jgi:hypothetical protein